jgi:hypothetical protein
MSKYAYANANCSLWPRQARPQSAMPKAIAAGLCVGIIAGISTSAVLTELSVSEPAQVVVQANEGTGKPVSAAAPMATQEVVAARPTPSQLAREIPTGSTPRAAVSAENDGHIASTDGRGGDAAIDRRAAAITTPSTPPASIPTASVPPASVPSAATPIAATLAASMPSASLPIARAPSAAVPLVEPKEAANPVAEPTAAASEPAAKVAASHPPRVVRKKRKRPTSYSARNRNVFPFFRLFGGGNGLFFGHRG